MKRLLVFIVAAMLVLAPATSAGAVEDDRPTVLVVGDSISAWYNDTPGSDSRAWWSFVAEHYGLRPIVTAEAGSGYWALGNKCTGTRFGGRLSAIKRERPDRVIVAGGFNDDHGCLNGRKVPIKQASTKKAIRSYLTALAREADAIGLPRDHIAVFTPWGTLKKTTHTWTWREQKAVAESLGMTYLTVRFLDNHQLRDKIHPNLKGSEKLAERVIITLGELQ